MCYHVLLEVLWPGTAIESHSEVFTCWPQSAVTETGIAGYAGESYAQEV